MFPPFQHIDVRRYAPAPLEPWLIGNPAKARLPLLGLVAGLMLIGSIFLGFTVYLAALGFQRSLITEPLVAGSSALPHEIRVQSARTALMPWLPALISAAREAGAAGAALSGAGTTVLALCAAGRAHDVAKAMREAALARDVAGRSEVFEAGAAGARVAASS